MDKEFSKLNKRLSEISTVLGIQTINPTQYPTLSPRELNVLSVLLNGEFYSRKEIAQKLGLKAPTVRYHFMNLTRKNVVFRKRRVGRETVYALTQRYIQTLYQRKPNRN